MESSTDKAFDAIKEIDLAIDSCDARSAMLNIRKAEEFAGKMHYEAGEEAFKTLAVREKIIETIHKFDTECLCHKV